MISWDRIEAKWFVLKMRSDAKAFDPNDPSVLAQGWRIRSGGPKFSEELSLRPDLKIHESDSQAWIQAAINLSGGRLSPPICDRKAYNDKTPESLKTIQHGGRHYKDLAIQPAEYCHRNKFQFCESEAIKYLSRFRSKKGAEDLKKAIHFAQMILEMEYGIQSTVDYSDDYPDEKKENNAIEPRGD